MFLKFFVAILVCDQATISCIDLFCRRIQAQIGITCFDLAKTLILVNFLHLTVVALKNKALTGFVVSILFTALIVLYQCYLLMIAQKLTKPSGSVTTLNPFRYNLGIIFGRLLSVWWLMLDFGAVIYGHGTFEAIFDDLMIYLYLTLICCTPLPPGASKLGEWVRNLSAPKLVPAPAGA